jgi:flavin-binding protein dodecin
MALALPAAGPYTPMECGVSVARVVEISSTSDKSFEDAINQGIARASKTLREIRSAWVKEQEVQVNNGKITAYKVNLKVTFVLVKTRSAADASGGPVHGERDLRQNRLRIP